MSDRIAAAEIPDVPSLRWRVDWTTGSQVHPGFLDLLHNDAGDWPPPVVVASRVGHVGEFGGALCRAKAREARGPGLGQRGLGQPGVRADEVEGRGGEYVLEAGLLQTGVAASAQAAVTESLARPATTTRADDTLPLRRARIASCSSRGARASLRGSVFARVHFDRTGQALRPCRHGRSRRTYRSRLRSARACRAGAGTPARPGHAGAAGACSGGHPLG